MDESNQAPGQAPDSSAAPQRAEDLENSAVVGNGLFSTAETSVETENLPPELGGSALEQPAPVLPQGNSSRISSAFGGGAASRSRTSGANPNFANNPNFTSSTIDSDINLAPTQPKKKSKLPIVIIIAILILGGAGGAFWFLAQSGIFDKKEEPIVGATNFDYLFDESAPIPAQEGDQYGYLDPENGSWIIEARYRNAGNFYGEYAAVEFEDRKSAIINRSGEVMVEDENNNTGYNIDYNIWLLGGSIYNSKLERINPEGTHAQYIDNGYIMVYPQEDKESAEPKSSDDDDGGSTTSSSSSAGQANLVRSIGYITNLDGKKAYQCEAVCSAYTTTIGGTVYAAVNSRGRASIIITLSDGKTIYTAGGANTISVNGFGNFSERTSNGDKYLTVKDGNVVVAPGTSVNMKQQPISGSNHYEISTCDSGLYKILDTSNADDTKTIVDCNIETYIEIPENSFRYFQMHLEKDLIFIKRDNGMELFDMKKAEVIHDYSMSDIQVFENSPFILVRDMRTAQQKVCNILKDASSCVDIDRNAQVNGYGNYFVLILDQQRRIYNAQLGVIL